MSTRLLAWPCLSNPGGRGADVEPGAITLPAMNPHVLMIDDNPGDVQLIEEAFKDCRIPVEFHAASDAPAAFEYLTRSEIGGKALPDVLILDLNLPCMQGPEVIGALRGHNAWKDIPIVVFSGRKHEPSDDALDADEVIEKPASYKKYLALVQRLKRYLPTSRGERSSRRGVQARSA